MNQKSWVLGLLAVLCCGLMGCVGAVFDIAGDVADAAIDVAEAPFDMVSGMGNSSLKVKVVEEYDWTFDAMKLELMRIDAETTNGSIVVKGSDRSDITVHAVKEIRSNTEEKAKDFAKLVVIKAEPSGGTLKVYKEHPKKPKNIQVMVKYEIQMPRDMNLELGSVNGAITIDHVTGEIAAKTTNGAIRITDFRGPVDAHTTNGSIALLNGISEAKIHTTNGSVKLEQYTGAVDAGTTNATIRADIVFLKGNSSLSTTNGSIQFNVHEGIASIYSSTTNGSVHLSLPEDFHGELDARTTNGRIHSNLPLTTTIISKKHVAGKLNQGGPAKITIQTTNGGITVDKIEN